MKFTRSITAWCVAFVMLALRYTCRVRLHGDPRPELRKAGKPYVFSILHAHQVAAAIKRERGTAAMVSRSADGALLLPGFWVLGITAIRGSSRCEHQYQKGGREALEQLVDHVKGNAPAYLAVDGSRGPRNRVRKGIAVLSQKTDAAVLNVVAVPSRRWILSKTWDRLQIPQPFCVIDAYFADPIYPEDDESVEDYRLRIENSLNSCESAHDTGEANAAA